MREKPIFQRVSTFTELVCLFFVRLLTIVTDLKPPQFFPVLYDKAIYP